MTQHLSIVTALALASAMPQAQAADERYYIAGVIGHHDYADLTVDAGPILGDVALDRDWSFGAALGTQVFEPLRLELEFISRSADARSLPQLALDDLDGGLDLTTVVLNAAYDFHINGSSLVPYVGVGAGWADVEVDDISSGFFRLSGNDQIAVWQLMLGLALPMSDRLTLSLDARYVQTEDVRFAIGPGAELSAEAQVESVSVNASVRFAF